MSGAKLKLVTITGSIDRLDATAFACADCDYFKPEDGMKYLASNLQNLSKLNEENPYKLALERLERTAAQAGYEIKACKRCRDNVFSSDFLPLLNEIENHILSAQAEKKQLNEEIQLCSSSKKQLEHFSKFRMSVSDVLDCQFITVRFGRLPVESYRSMDLYENNPFIIFIPLSLDPEYCWGLYIAPTREIDSADRVFAGLFFEKLDLPTAITSPAEAIEQLNRQKQSTENKIGEIDQAFYKYWKRQQNTIARLYYRLERFSYVFGIRRSAVRHVNSFALMGYIPPSKTKHFHDYISQVGTVEVSV